MPKEALRDVLWNKKPKTYDDMMKALQEYYDVDEALQEDKPGWRRRSSMAAPSVAYVAPLPLRSECHPSGIVPRL